jgi:hypothetical protein
MSRALLSTLTVSLALTATGTAAHHSFSAGDDVDVSEQGTCDPAGYYRDIYEAGQLEERLGVQ